MSKITVISRLTHKETVVDGSLATLGDSSVVKIEAGRGEIASYSRNGNDLLVRMNDGETVTLKNYFSGDNELVLSENGTLWWIEDPLAVESYQTIPSTDALIAGSVSSNSSSDTPIWPWVLGGLAAAGGIALAAGGGGGGGGGGGDDRVEPGPLPLDTTPPAAPSNLRFSADSTQLLGNAEPNSNITVRDAEGNIIGRTKTNGNGDFTVELGTPYTNGETLTVTASDASGNVSPSNSITAADTTPPDVPEIITADDNVGSLTGSLNSDQTTDDTRPVFSGSGTAGSTITIYDNGVAIGTTVVNSEGSWTFTPTKDLSEGFHQITVTARDAAGNESEDSAVFNLTVDTIAPNAPVVQVNDNAGTVQGLLATGSFTDATQPSLTGTGDPGSTITIYDNNLLVTEVIVAANGTWSYTPTKALVDGLHSITLTETDLAGNMSPVSVPFEFTIDRLPPGAPSGLAVNADGTVLTGNAEPNATVSVTNDLGVDLGTATADANGAFTLTLNPAQANGETLTAVATDRAGNEGPGAPLTVRDSTAPGAPAALSINQAGDTLTGEAEAGARISIRNAAGDEISSGTVELDGTFRIGISPAQTNGEELTVYAFDTANNQSGPAQITAFDSTPPDAPADLALADAITLSGVAEVGSTVVIKEGTATLGELVVDDTGRFSFTLPTIKENGEIMELTATDKAGNTSKVSSVEAEDKIPPAIPVITDVKDDVATYIGSVERGGMTDDRTPLIIGTGEANTKIFIYSGEHQVGFTEVNAAGNWSFQVPASLTEGINVLTADAVDRRGNHSERSENWTITIDPNAPNPPDTLIYTVLDEAGGDHVGNFSLAEGDKIDISALLIGWNGSNATLGSYLHVSNNDDGTLISIDRDGAGTAYTPTALVTLEDVQTTYEELVNQNHIIAG